MFARARRPDTRARGAAVSPPDPSPVSEPAESGGEAPESRLTRVAFLLPVIGAPLGLLFAILASLMISGWRVTHSAIVQVETRWRADETLALRVHVLDGDGAGVPGAEVRASLVRGEQSVQLAELRDATGGGATQGTVRAPAWTPGPAELALAVRGGGREFTETVAVELVAAREARRGDLTISTSVKNWSDDTEPQPERLRIALRPFGRLAAGFENTLLVRVTDPEGRPHVGPVEVALLDGEFGGHRGGRDGAPVIASASTDAQGLLRFDGQLSTDVVRFEVRVPAPVPKDMSAGTAPAGAKDGAGKPAAAPVPKDMSAGTAPAGAKDGAGKPAAAPVPKDMPAGTAPAGAKDGAGKPAAAPVPKDMAAETAVPGPGDMAAGPAPPAPLGARKFRLVSFAGAVRVTAEPLALAPGGALEIKARGLRAKKAVFVDLHGPDGAWIDTLAPVTGPEPPRSWTVGALTPGFLQVEAYQFTTAPGESTALARVQITAGDPDTDAALGPLFVQQRALLELGRVEKGFDRELERKYLDIVEKAEVAGADVPLARAWLMGTLPIEVLGPPVALSTLPREQVDVVERKQRWATGLRWFLLAGGGAFLLLTLLLIVVSHRRAAARLTGEIHGEGATKAIAREIAEAQRAVLLRAVALVVTMALALVLTVVVLDKILWQTQ